MRIVEDGDNEFIVDPSETVWINFDTLNWANLWIRVSEDGGASFNSVSGHFFSFVGNESTLDLLFEFNFAQPGFCSIDVSGSNGGDTFGDRARFFLDRPDQKEFSFHP